MAASVLEIDYYTDVLCVWAWIAQRRVDELNDQFGEQIILRPRFVDVFGDTAGKMDTAWASRGGWDGFAEHVQESAARFEHVSVHPELWQHNKPSSSGQAHLVLKAAGIMAGDHATTQLALAIRQAFFMQAQDISDLTVLEDIVTAHDFDWQAIQTQLTNGKALAALLADYQQAHKDGIRGSPSFVMDNNRQTLFGNVGYRVLAANIEELLKQPTEEASWC